MQFSVRHKALTEEREGPRLAAPQESRSWSPCLPWGSLSPFGQYLPCSQPLRVLVPSALQDARTSSRLRLCRMEVQCSSAWSCARLHRKTWRWSRAWDISGVEVKSLFLWRFPDRREYIKGVLSALQWSEELLW